MTLSTPLTPAGPHRHLFIVRVWSETQQPKPETWRGSVEHVPSGQRLYFSSFIDLADFIGLRVGGETHHVNPA